MSKHQLQEGILLLYTGKPFEGFTIEQPHVTFLGYDTPGWTNIWVDYQGETRLVSLFDIELITT